VSVNALELKKFLAAMGRKDRLFPIIEGTKRPSSSWTNQSFSDEQVIEKMLFDDFNAAYLMSSIDLVIDIDVQKLDPSVDAERFKAEFIEEWGLGHCLRVGTPSGGCHIFMKKDPSVEVVTHSARYQNVVEFKSEKSYVLTAGSHTFKTEKHVGGCYVIEHLGSPDALVPNELFEMVRKDRISKKKGDVILATNEEIAALLAQVPSEDLEYAEWRDLAMACHSGSEGAAIEEFVAWTRSNPKYDTDKDEVDTRKYWSDFNGEGGVTLRTLHHAVRKNGGAVPSDPTKGFEDIEAEPVEVKKPGPDMRLYGTEFRNYWLEKQDVPKKGKAGEEGETEEKWVPRPLKNHVMLNRFKEMTAFMEVGIYGDRLCMPAADRTKVLQFPTRMFGNILSEAKDLNGENIDPGLSWMRGVDMVDKDSFGKILEVHLPQITKIRNVPTWPMSETDMNLAGAEKFRHIDAAASSAAFEGFIDFFNPSTFWDRALLKCLFMAYLWNAGKKPAFLITSSDEGTGKDTGKTTVPQKFNLVISGTEAVDEIDLQQFSKPIGQQMVDIILQQPEVFQFLIDNTDGATNANTQALEKQISSFAVQGHATHVGTRKFDNTFVYVLTTNELSFSPDMAIRMFNIVLDRPKEGVMGWNASIDAYIRGNRDEIIMGALAILSRKPEYEIGRIMSKNEDFCNQIITKCFSKAEWDASEPEITGLIKARMNMVDRSKQLFADLDEFILHDLTQEQGEDLSKFHELAVKRVYLRKAVDAFFRDRRDAMPSNYAAFEKEFVIKSKIVDRGIAIRNQNFYIIRGSGIERRRIMDKFKGFGREGGTPIVRDFSSAFPRTTGWAKMTDPF